MSTTSKIVDLPGRFRLVRVEMGWSQATMASILDLTKTGISNIENRRAYPTLHTLEKLSVQTEINIDWILTGRGPKYWADQEKIDIENLPQPVVTFSTASRAPEGVNEAHYRAVPLLTDPVAAGEPMIGTDVVEEWAWIHASQVGKRKNLVAIRIKGRSMHPLILDGAIVAIDRDDWKPPGLFAVRVGEGVTVKRVKRIGKKSLLLVPENREFEEALVELAKGQSLQDVVIGRAVWQWSDLTKV